MTLNYLDLFSGIGGFTLGIIQAGIEFDKHYYSEVDKYANQIYEKHFPEAVGLGNIRNIKTEGLGKIDLITFGFPCQDLSIAGKREGIRGGRSGLFFEAMRIIKELRPDTFIFENVKGLLTSNEGKDFEVVLREIADIGLYECEWQLVNTSWVLPQNRERIYFIGHLGKGSGQKVFPIGTSNRNDYDLGEKTEREQSRISTKDIFPTLAEGEKWKGFISATLSAGYYKRQHGQTMIKEGFINSDSQGQRVYSPEGISSQLTSQGGGWGAKTGLYAVLTPNRKQKRQHDRRMKNSGEPMFTLTGQDIHGVCNSMGIRRLTPIECERLQGFPDNFTKGISDTQRYKTLGNAVSVPIVKMIIERLYR
jgi:DNA (cytosine-5)-methyltransferase 1